VCKRLREIAQLLPIQANLLGIQSKMVGIAEQLSKNRGAFSVSPLFATHATYQNEQMVNAPSFPLNRSISFASSL
jgi:hypothetical protein